MSLVYLAKQAINGLFATAGFLARGITNYTVASPSELLIFGKPSNKQLAFDGYSSNIEAFICATSIKRKVLCDQSHYPIDPTYEVTLPIALPRTVFALRDKPTAEQEKKMLEAGKDMGLEKVEVGKGHVYTVERPTLTFLEKIRRVAPDQCTNLTDYSQIGATISFHQILQFVDLFLATNTYSYKPEDHTGHTGSSSHPVVDVHYKDGASWAVGFDTDVAYKARKTSAGWTSIEHPDVDKEMFHDSMLTNAGNAVFVAKPSPLPSNTSWGLPKDCPNSSGIHFPYFDGLQHSDVSFTRSMVNRHFFRNLGSIAKSPKDAFNEFRTKIGPAVSTSSGRAINHILYGIDLALGTQTQLYVLVDNGKYLGFNLLGGYFSIWSNGWIEPMDEDALKAEMTKYQSHEASLIAFTKLLKDKAVKWVQGFKIPKVNIKRSQEVLAALGAIDQGETHADVLGNIEEALKGLTFPGLYRKMNADNLETAINELLDNQALPKGQSVYIPVARSAWKSLNSEYAAVICSFGARSFSLIDRGGKASEVALDSSVFKKAIGPKDKADKVKTTLPFFEKPFHECIADWSKVVQTGKAKVNFAERAIGSRGFLVRGDSMVEIIEIFETAKANGKTGKGAPKVEGKKKKADDVVMGEVVTLDDLF